MISSCVIRTKLDSAPVFTFAFGVIHLARPFGCSQSSMSLAENRVQLQCLFCRGDDLRSSFVQPHVTDDVTVCKPNICKCVRWILFYRLLKIFDGFVCRCIRSLVPVITSLQIKLIGFGILRLVLGKALLLCSGETLAQFL